MHTWITSRTFFSRTIGRIRRGRENEENLKCPPVVTFVDRTDPKLQVHSQTKGKMRQIHPGERKHYFERKFAYQGYNGLGCTYFLLTFSYVEMMGSRVLFSTALMHRSWSSLATYTCSPIILFFRYGSNIQSTVNGLKFRTFFSFYSDILMVIKAEIHKKMFARIPNTEDPGQTASTEAVWSGSALSV